ncbi:hypothetical protein [Kitasatospora aureofaciens]|uniref:hypothetical protein n=1 Tax=Kitasatospora aureofaciens TaxID=1894 RepID=UPI001C47E6D3|nr:hypothetical protein [Kitasatospora aureofaciens]MBV6699759.1 hypothetical protein [Kitasatospora aureofaciens]
MIALGTLLPGIAYWLVHRSAEPAFHTSPTGLFSLTVPVVTAVALVLPPGEAREGLGAGAFLLGIPVLAAAYGNADPLSEAVRLLAATGVTWALACGVRVALRRAA